MTRCDVVTAMTEPVSSSMTVVEFAAAIGKSKRQVFRYVTQGRLRTVPSDDMSRQSLRIVSSELNKFFPDRASVHAAQPAIDDVMTSSSVSPSDTHVTSDDTDSDDMSSHVTRTSFHLDQDILRAVPLERYEAAVLRMGWLQSELESMRRALTDGGQREADLKAAAEAAAAARLQLEVERAVATTRAQQAEQRQEELTLELQTMRSELHSLHQELQKPWWKRWFPRLGAAATGLGPPQPSP